MMRIRYLIVSLVTTLVVGYMAWTNIFVLHDSKPYREREYSPEGDGSVHAYLINLDQSKDRLAEITPKLQNLGISYTRIPGVYGRGLSSEEKDQLVNRHRYLSLMHGNIGDGTVGCYLSHIKVWETFLESKSSYAIVFEDDADFVPSDLKDVIDELIKCKDRWDVVTFDYLHYGHPMKILDLSQDANGSLVKFRTRVGNTGCYLINRKAAISLLKKSLPIAMPVDHYFVRSWELGLKFTGVMPKVVHQRPSASIRKQMDSRDTVSLRYKISSTIYQIFSQAATCVYAYLW
ncbi:MAG: glycosyltransferase family 25 protein [Holosporales bacterium]|jgi:glycosyl transferase family 25|nr:glycosyltransferase family 25 protein [Holosporales bacterium]